MSFKGTMSEPSILVIVECSSLGFKDLSADINLPIKEFTNLGFLSRYSLYNEESDFSISTISKVNCSFDNLVWYRFSI